jgi:formylglycine-generating enzyme required for sulfatase activity
MLRIPAGKFMMGTDLENTSYSAKLSSGESPARPVKVAPFYLCDREVTRKQFALYLRWKEDDNFDLRRNQTNSVSLVPAESAELPQMETSFVTAREFCEFLNQVLVADPESVQDGGGHYRLPTEEEWEYACRAGTLTDFSCGNGEYLSDYARFFQESALPVASKLPNRWGLFDMHGNANEWCDSPYEEDDLIGAKVHRGGWHAWDALDLRSAARNGNNPSNSYENGYGFRVARSCN